MGVPHSQTGIWSCDRGGQRFATSPSYVRTPTSLAPGDLIPQLYTDGLSQNMQRTLLSLEQDVIVMSFHISLATEIMSSWLRLLWLLQETDLAISQQLST